MPTGRFSLAVIVSLSRNGEKPSVRGVNTWCSLARSLLSPTIPADADLRTADCFTGMHFENPINENPDLYRDQHSCRSPIGKPCVGVLEHRGACAASPMTGTRNIEEYMSYASALVDTCTR